MKNFRINPDRKFVDIIIEGLERKQGHCPCRVEVNDSTLCPCDEFIEKGICKCRLYVPLYDEKDKSSANDKGEKKEPSKK